MLSEKEKGKRIRKGKKQRKRQGENWRWLPLSRLPAQTMAAVPGRQAKRRRCIRRYVRRVRWQKGRRLRRAAAGLVLAAALYLTAAGAVGTRIFSLPEEKVVEYSLPFGKGEKQEVLRIVFRLKTGELYVYREERIHNGCP